MASRGADAKHCPYVENCELYPLFRLRASLETWKLRYCEASYLQCERYRLTVARQKVPANLLPNGKELPLPKKGQT